VSRSTRSSSSRIPVADEVEEMTINVAREMPAKVSPESIGSRSGRSGSMTTSTSAASAGRRGESAQCAPCSSNDATRSAERWATCTSNPARSALAAIGVP
jgi:hypothetical protein